MLPQYEKCISSRFFVWNLLLNEKLGFISMVEKKNVPDNPKECNPCRTRYTVFENIFEIVSF